MKPCRDCGAPTAPSARSCPKCGILNPVMHWVSLPEGGHLTAREWAAPGGFAAPALAFPNGAAAAAALAPRPRTGGSTHWLGKYFAAIDSRDEADEAIRDCSRGFFFIAGLSAVAGLILGAGMLVDAALLGGLAFWLRSRASRAAAVLLLVLAVLGVVSTVMARLGMGDGGRNVILAVITLGIAWRSVVATRVLGRLGPAAA